MWRASRPCGLLDVEKDMDNGVSQSRIHGRQSRLDLSSHTAQDKAETVHSASLCGDRWAGGSFLHCRPGSSECDSHSKLLWHSSLNRHRWEDQTTCPFLRVLGQMCSCNVPSRSKDTFLTLWWHLPLVDGHWGFPGGWVGKESACQCRRCMGLIPGSGRCPGEPIPVFLPGKSHGQRSLADYRSWGHKRVGHDRATKQQQIGHCPGRGTCLGSYSGSQWGTPGLWL